jgi:predicted membrane-bound spermidine synthase
MYLTEVSERNDRRLCRIFSVDRDSHVENAKPSTGTELNLVAGPYDRTFAGRHTRDSTWWYLVLVDVLLAALALSIPLVLPALGALQSTPRTFSLAEWCVSLMVVATGVLGGAAFPFAGRLQLAAIGRIGTSVGAVVGADHAGAGLGALLCGILLVPVFGTAAAFLLAGMKLCSAAVLAVGSRLARAT